MKTWTQAGYLLVFRSASSAGVLMCWGLLMVLSSAGHAHLIADIPYSLPGIGLSIVPSVHQWIAPVCLAMFYWRAAQSTSAPAIQILLLAAASSALAGVWLVTLARHDRLLSLFQVLLLLWVIWQALPRLSIYGALRVSLLALSTCTMTVISYGAIWGETRCQESAAGQCLTTSGPRIWVPAMLAGAGLPVFAQLNHTDLQAADLSNRDLRYADLRGANLNTANLAGSNLRRARLQGANGAHSNWRGAYLDGATFAGADLNNARLDEIHAWRVDFRAANLAHAQIRNASLSHSWLAGAQLTQTTLNATYLRFVEGLTAAQLAQACGDQHTLLPPGFDIRICPHISPSPAP